ncbi:hypothetical protein DSO57_1026498 [Entomophthora muscae]|uniref:Uncharacterized protein n=1 Tax=Entomophthora muscae TaxID=34485 RepID=A0ACC2RGR2_9FUNG|nr:hypothetical protein DSO57_1026498 [Entomophthora muscae]
MLLGVNIETDVEAKIRAFEEINVYLASLIIKIPAPAFKCRSLGIMGIDLWNKALEISYFQEECFPKISDLSTTGKAFGVG